MNVFIFFPYFIVLSCFCKINWCEGKSIKPCNKNTEFTCVTDKLCIHKSWVCDGEEDCHDGSDEKNCKKAACLSSEFKCKNKNCIPKNKRCDLYDHCGDNSDEVGCPTLPSLACSTKGSFHCDKSKICIDQIKVCDKTKDCPNGDDEPAKCGVNECLKNNAGCSHICTDLKIGFKCSCKPGYILDDDKKSCHDIDECEVYGSCSQTCTNSIGSYKCSCHRKYTLQADGKSCEVKGPRPLLVIANKMDVIQVTTDGKNLERLIPAKQIGSVLATDINANDEYLYWADHTRGTISRTKTRNSSKTEVIANGKLTETEGIAVDWIGNNIYWTNSGAKSIEVAKTDGSYRKQLITSGLDKPRGIAVFPSKRLVFWTDWGSSPKIESASMDGEDRETIIDSDHVQWPNAVAIDQLSERLYWVDRRMRYIGSSGLDGSDIKTIVSSNIDASFGLTVFESFVYWTQTSGKVFKANKIDGSDLKEIRGAFFTPYTVQINHPAAKLTGQNPCGVNNGGCSQLCLLSSEEKKGFSCACADGFELDDDDKACIQDAE